MTTPSLFSDLLSDPAGADQTLLSLLPPARPASHGTLITYFKRYKMEIDLHDLPAPQLPEGFHWVAWQPTLSELHADVLYSSFENEVDALVFTSLGERAGCRALMNELARRSTFIPAATWLLAQDDQPCGTIQGLRERSGVGAIQNLGILPQYRGRGLGIALLLQALHGFRQSGVSRTVLEVTAQNERALRLYSRLGFRRTKTTYKAVSLNDRR